MTRKILAILCLALLASFGVASGGCVAGSADDGSVTKTTIGELTLEEASAVRVAGGYTHDGYTISFEAIANDAERHLTIKSSSGKVLIETTDKGVGRVMRALDGRVAYSFAPATAADAPSGVAVQFPAEKVREALTVAGDEDAMSALLSSPEAAIIAWLSHDLGARGITGFAYPASFEIHSVGMMIAKAQAIDLPPLEGDMLATTTRAAEGESCERNPGNDECFGMCGRGCGCWKWSCGDCCYHKGCAAHDTECRKCSWRHPGACAACVSMAPFFTGGRCSVW